MPVRTPEEFAEWLIGNIRVDEGECFYIEGLDAALRAHEAAIRQDERELWAAKLQEEAMFQAARDMAIKYQYAGLVLRNQAKKILANEEYDRLPIRALNQPKEEAK